MLADSRHLDHLDLDLLDLELDHHGLWKDDKDKDSVYYYPSWPVQQQYSPPSPQSPRSEQSPEPARAAPLSQSPEPSHLAPQPRPLVLTPTPQQQCFWTGWHTICPRLLSPTAVVQPLLHHRRLTRSPSPTPTMSSDDDPATDAVFVQPKSRATNSAATATSPNNSSNAAAAPATQPRSATASKLGASSSDDGPGSTLTSAGSGSSRSKDFWHTNALTSEPSLLEGSQSSNGSHPHLPPRPSRWTKARSTSTESSLSLSGITNFGSTYNQDGFPNYPVSSEEEHMATDDAAIAKQLALTDEAVRAINGTPGVVQAGSLGMPMSTPNTYELPRSMAAYVRRPDGTGDRDLRTGRSFVSSGSSTSSEESEHLASVQWVTTAVNSTTPQYSYSPYPRPLPPPNRSSPNMPPPSSTHKGPQSPRRNGGNGLPSSTGSGSGSGTTQGQSFSAPLPPTAAQTGASAEGSPENGDDDDQTVGGMREGSPSSSSASGLDLLSHAAAHHERTRYSTSVRRKAGAEAVAQWRESGIPSGSPRIGEMMGPPGYDSPGYESTPSAEGHGPEESVEPPKKRRKSNMMETPDANLRHHTAHHQQAKSEGGEHDHHGDGGSDYASDASASDSEYHAKGSGSGRKRGSTSKNKKPRVRATLLIPPAPTPPTGSSAKPQTTATPKKPTAKASTPTAGKANAARRGSDGTEAAIKAGGVQCDYVNPLPPYQRCPDVFTRKYDIPRHMARHARREGDLVAEGKLPEEKALLWKTIRDKPRIRCKTCGEYFTRQDALKRHQSKQHH